MKKTLTLCLCALTLAAHGAPKKSAYRYSRWSIGVSAGTPFFWGDMNSLAGDKTYIGATAGLQATWQATPFLGVSATADYALNKAGSRSYAAGYQLAPDGFTYYKEQAFPTMSYGDLYSRIGMWTAGLHLDLNVNRLAGPCMAYAWPKLIVSPGVYALHFDTDVRRKSDNSVYVKDMTKGDISLGLGGDVVLRQKLSRTLDLQLRGTGMWIVDREFDNIATVGYARQNAYWALSAGVIFKLGGVRRANLIYKLK